jgi:hypothetical protein
LIHPSAKDFEPLIRRSVLNSVLLIVHQLQNREGWLTISELAEYTELGPDTIGQITSLIPELFQKFPCPEHGRGREVAILLTQETARSFL